MKPFDLEAAKRGEPVIDIPSGCPVHFVGTTRDGDCIVELIYTAGLVKRSKNELRMAPKKQTVWVWFDKNNKAMVCKDEYLQTSKLNYPDSKFTKVEIEE